MSAVAKLQAVLGMDSKEFKSGMKSATKETSTFQGQIKQIGSMIGAAFSVGAIVAAGKSLATWASDVSEAAQNAGVLTSEMMALNEIAVQGGLGVDEMRRMLSKMQTELNDAANGTETARKKFEDLGLNVTELAGMNPAQMFQAVAKAAMESESPLSALADIFGDKLGPKAMSAMRDLADNGLPAVGQAAADAADEIERLGDKYDSFAEKIKRWSLKKVVDTAEGMAVAGAFVKGALSNGIGFGVSAAMSKQGQQWSEDESVSAERQKNMDAQSAALKKKAADTDVKKSLESNRKAEEARQKGSDSLKKQWADEESQRQKGYAKNRAIGDENRAFAEKMARLQEQLLPTASVAGAATMNQGGMASVGGFMGGERAGFDIASKSLEVQREQLRISREMLDLQRSHEEALATKGGVSYG